MPQPLALTAWNKLSGSSLGRWLFSKLVCFKAPYFATISPRITALQPNLCEAFILQRRKVQNHIGTVHAIALCNLAELCAGLVTDVSIPADMRWIPKGMTVSYLKKAKGKMSARGQPAKVFYSAQEGYAGQIDVTVTDEHGVVIFTAEIAMWISPKT
jgi:acyl-coenzyme A thioesterase PaaI-like protein